MTEKYLKPLKRRNSASYADAYSCFAVAQELVTKSERGELIDEELKQKLEEL